MTRKEGRAVAGARGQRRRGGAPAGETSAVKKPVPTDRLLACAGLKALPTELQQQIVRHSRKGDWAKVRRQLQRQGVGTTEEALEQFAAYWRLRQLLETCAQHLDTVFEFTRQRLPGAGPEDLAQFALLLFQVLCLAEKDPATFVRLYAAGTRAKAAEHGLQLRQQALELEREKYQFDVAEECRRRLPELRAIADDQGLSTADKLAHIRKVLFGALAEAASGGEG